MFKLILKKSKYYSLYIKRFLIILFSKNRRLKNVNIDYEETHRFHNSLLIIHFSAKNFICIKVGGIIVFDISKPLILNVSNINSDLLPIEFVGFFQSEKKVINISKDVTLNNGSFKTKISINGTFEFNEHNCYLNPNNPKLKNQETVIHQPKINIYHKKYKITHKPFNLKEYI